MKITICVIAILGNPDSGATRGVVDKVTAQVSALREAGYEAYGVFGLTPPHLLNSCPPYITCLPFASRLGKLFYKAAFFQAALAYLTEIRPDVVYLRYPLAGPALTSFLRLVRRAHPRIKIIVERQTKEIPELLAQPSAGTMIKASLERLYRCPAQKLIDLNVGVTQEICDYITGYDPKARCIRMGNGIPSDILDWRDERLRPKDGPLRLVFVGNITRWSGLELVIQQLLERDFNHRGRAICLDIIGEGVFLNNLRAKVPSGCEAVVFHGYLAGEVLWQKVALADLALGALNNKKRLLTEGSNLKLRLYAALGVPFVLSEYDTDFSASPEADGLFIDVSGYETVNAACLEAMLNFALDASPDLPMRARAFARSTLTWEAKMEKMMQIVLEATNVPPSSIRNRAVMI